MVVVVVAAVDDLCIFMDLKSLSHFKFRSRSLETASSMTYKGDRLFISLI